MEIYGDLVPRAGFIAQPPSCYAAGAEKSDLTRLWRADIVLSHLRRKNKDAPKVGHPVRREAI